MQQSSSRKLNYSYPMTYVPGADETCLLGYWYYSTVLLAKSELHYIIIGTTAHLLHTEVTQHLRP